MSKQRTETLSGINTTATFTGECGTVPEGQWMFLDGWNGNYVCLRPRLGADCAWVRRSAIGDVAELYPGRTFEQGNKGISCAQWATVVEKSAAKEKDYTNKWLASRPKNAGEEFAQGMLSAVVGTFTGGADKRLRLLFRDGARAGSTVDRLRALPGARRQRQEGKRAGLVSIDVEARRR